MTDIFRQHIEQIVTLTDSEYEQVRSHFIPKKIRKFHTLIREGDLVFDEYFVMKGCLKAYKTDEEGKDHILQFALEEWWISDFKALAMQTPATINVVALENCEMLCLAMESRERLCRDLHKMEYFFRKKTLFGYIALQQRVLSLLSSTAKERYELLLQQYPQLFQRVPKTLIASYLGVSRETLSRLNKS
ncbi:MAG TPA: Crp/Fnr family transcriptional regulator [Chitinophaga sp.]|uniref:Crp/Fnr family transcriptional regulator n=1 Tax=Chitinophaga sp. TaxID=1869181 RepID=UPI002CC4F8E0|nr:Crp/Fnr family transcriptional regulator [Chitinophaga sp.]HVI48935.1 Crp/Fnr family transcriptional regulator [Chitinophaga sp.]